MKKQLLASTLLVAAGALTASSAAEAKFAVTVNGYMEAIVGAAIQEEGNDPNSPEDTGRGYQGAGADVDYDGEIHFNARTELDNGIKIRAHVELETGHGGAGGGDPLDEEYMIIRGNFGQLTIGSEDNAGHLMTIGYLGHWATAVGQNLSFDVEDFLTTGGRARETLWDNRLVLGDNDSTKISYYTPRFAGLQLGASYIPNFVQDNNAYPNADTATHDGFAVGTNYVRKFGKVGIGVGAGFLSAKGAENGTAPSSAMTQGYVLAGRVDFGPVRVSGGFKEISNSPVKAKEGNNFTAGVRLSLGPNRFSLTHITGRAKGTDVNDGQREKQSRTMFSYARTLGPGVSWTANVMANQFEDDNEAANGERRENNGVAVSTSVKLRF